jgi:GNAT superfamily N-acetyltransferase
MKLTLREARPLDLDFIVRGNTEMALETEGVELDPALVGAGTLAVLQDRTLGRYFIAESAGRPLGQMMLTFEWSDWRNGVFWWIQSVFVDPDYRGKGVFSGLYRYVSELAAASPEVCGLRLYVDRGNARARSIYASVGMHSTNYDVMEVVFRGPASHRDS